MKILVCIGHVPDTTSKIKFTNNNSSFDTSDIQYIIGPYEELGLTRILDIKKAGADLTITVVNVGTSETEATLRKALAMGADEAIRVNAEAKDAIFVAKQIANICKQANYDLILTGKESIDYNSGQVDGMIAEFLNLPSFSGVSKFEIVGNVAKMEREIDGGKEIIECAFPFVLSAGKGFALEPRIPNMQGIMTARRKALQVIEPEMIAEATSTVKFHTPPPRPACKKVSTDNVAELVRLLHEEAKVI